MFDIIKDIPYAIWMLMSVSFFTYGEFLSKKFANNPNLNVMLYAILIYAIGSIFWFPAILQKNHLTILGTIWLLFGLLGTIFVGLVIYQEKVNSYNIAGIILAIIAMFLLQKN